MPLLSLFCPPELPSAETLSTRCLQHGKRRSPPQRDTESPPGHSQPRKLWPFLLPPLEGCCGAQQRRAEGSPASPCQLPETKLQLSQFSKWEKGGSEGWGWRLLLPLLGAGAAPSTNRCQQQSSAAIPTPRLGGLTAASGALSLPRSVPGQGPSPLLHRCL